MWTTDNAKIQSFLKDKCQIENNKIAMLAGDASNRKYFRITGAMSDSYVLMAWEPFDPNRYPFFSVLNHFKKHKITVPEAIHFDEHTGLVLLEDLGDLPLEQVFMQSQKSEAGQCSQYQKYYDQAIEELIKIHFQASADRSPCIAFDLDFNIEKLSWELDFTRTHLFENLLAYSFSPAESQLYSESILNLTQHLHQQPKYIQHRDYHSRNLMLKDNQIRVIDFQDARMGAIQYDLVSLFKDSYVDFPAYLEEAYLRSYFQEAQKFKYPITSYEQFFYTYNLQAIQRCLKACGSFASFKVLKNDDRYLKYLKPTLKRVQKIMLMFPEYQTFTDLVTQTGAFQ